MHSWISSCHSSSNSMTASTGESTVLLRPCTVAGSCRHITAQALFSCQNQSCQLCEISAGRVSLCFSVSCEQNMHAETLSQPPACWCTVLAGRYLHPETSTSWPMYWEPATAAESAAEGRICRTAAEQWEDAEEKEFGVDGLPLIMRWVSSRCGTCYKLY